MKRRSFLGILGAASAASAAVGMNTKMAHQSPKYVFLMIGDGMGVNQRAIAERYARQAYPTYEGGLSMNQLPVYGLTATDNVLGETTCSAAAGTALACGQKTVKGAIGMAQDLVTPLRSVALEAKASGKKVGIISSVAIDHATPACFYASVPNRNMYYEIDEFIPRSNFDYFAGEPMMGRKKVKGRVPPADVIQAAGYQMVDDRAGFDALKSGDEKVLVEYPLGYAIDGPQEISLADYTRKGIELLDGDEGFFMMVEGGKIDWSGHANDLATNVQETLAFDEAVEDVLNFCKAHPKECLLIVTADHETGGLKWLPNRQEATIVPALDAQGSRGANYVTDMVRWRKSGAVSADQAYERLTTAFGLTDLTDPKRDVLYASIAENLSDGVDDTRDAAIKKMYGKRNPAVVGCLHEVAERSGAKWTSFGHTSARVATTAYGQYATRFGGEKDNTDIGLCLKEFFSVEV